MMFLDIVDNLLNHLPEPKIGIFYTIALMLYTKLGQNGKVKAITKIDTMKYKKGGSS